MKRIAIIACVLCITTSPLMASDLPEQDAPIQITQTETNRMAISELPTAGPMMASSAEPMELADPMVVVKELVIAERVSEREPISVSDSFPFSTERLYCFSRISAKEVSTVSHVWYRDNKRVAEIALNVGVSSSWRTWSSKAIPYGSSEWRVEVISEAGEILAETEFTIQ